MPRSRLLPALAAIALVPALAACGGGGDDGSSTTAAAPATSTSTAAAPTTTATTSSTSTGATTSTGGSSGTTTSSGSSGATSRSNPLASYVRGGSSAEGATADAVREGLITVGTALSKRDAKTACTRIAGAEAALRAGGLKNVSCAQALSQLAQAGSVPKSIPQSDFTVVRKAPVTIKGAKATLELNGQPLPMVRQGGVWKVNLGAIFSAATKAAG